MFGCTCFIQNHSLTRKFIFLGYSQLSKSYHYYGPISRHMYNSWDITFLKYVPFSEDTPYLRGNAEKVVPSLPNLLTRPIPLFDSMLVPSPLVSRPPPQVYTRHPCVPLRTSSFDTISSNPPFLSIFSHYLSYTCWPLIDLAFLVLLITLFLSTFPIMSYLLLISLFLLKFHLFIFPSLYLRILRIHSGW